MWRTRLTDCLRIFSGCGGRGLRIVYGFFPDVADEAYGLFTDFFPDVEDEAALLFSRATWFVGNKGFLEHKV